MQKGDVNRTGRSPYPAPFDLSGGPSWVWKDPYTDVIRFTPLIDDKHNIYLGTLGGRLYKFNPDGAMLWTHKTSASIPTVPALMDGRLFFNRKDGYVLALDMETGQEQWAVKISDHTGGDTACVFALEGLVVSATEMGKPPSGSGTNNAVVALHAANGSHAWTFRHYWPTFNFQASSPGDGTMVFMDRAGGVYRLNLTGGILIWESGVTDRGEGDFTTGAAVVGPNGLVYCASNYRGNGVIHAYRLDDGAQVWWRPMGMEVNQAVAVGPLAGDERLSVVAGIGSNPLFPALFYWVIFLNLLNVPVMICSCCCLCVQACRAKRLNLGWKIAAAVLVAICETVLIFAMHFLSLAWEAKPPWLFGVRELPAAMVALDAQTGVIRWSYGPPPFRKPACEGDESMLLPRLYNLNFGGAFGDPICLPDNWAQTVIDGAGTTYGGFQDGYLYAVRDTDGSGSIDEANEVSRYFLGAAFQASQAIAPGMLAVAPCGGGLYVWKY